MLASRLAASLLACVEGPVPGPVPEPVLEEGEAEGSPGEVARAGAVVVVGIEAGDALVSEGELVPVLAGHLAGTGLRHRVALLSPRGRAGERLAWASTFARDGDVLAVFWVGRVGEARRLFLFEPRGGTTWVRELPATTDPDDLQESLGAMVRGISVWLEHGPPPGMAMVEPEPPEPSEPPIAPPPVVPEHADPEPPAEARWGLELAYAGGSLADGAAWQSGGGLGLDVEWPMGVMARVTASGLAPIVLPSIPHTTVWRVPLTAGVGIRFRRDRRLRPWVDASLVVEPMLWRARTTAEAEGRSGATVRLAVAPGAGLRWELRGGWFVLAHLRADGWVRDADLVVSVDGRHVPRLRPHALAASARIGAGITF